MRKIPLGRLYTHEYEQRNKLIKHFLIYYHTIKLHNIKKKQSQFIIFNYQQISSRIQHSNIQSYI